MTTSADINALRTSGPAATAEQAQRAVKAFRALQPTLTAYARNLTGRNDVRVEMAAADNGSTDGTRIFFRPPIALGVDTKHTRSICGKRDKASQLNLCAACDAREDVLVTIYHEIAHIAFETFVDVDDEEAAQVAADAAEAAGGAWAKHVAERIRKAPGYMKRNYMAVANLASPFMPLLWNALEDARVNAEMFSARPGTKVMFDSNTRKIFEQGVEQVDKTTGEVIVKKWDEYPANMQILVGLFCKASGYNYRGWFAPQIERALEDEVLNQLLVRMPTIRSTRGIYNLCFPLLTRLRQLGFCKTDDEPEEEPDEAAQQDEPVEEEPSAGEDQPEQEEKEDDGDAESDPGDDGDGGEDASDESDVRPGDADSEGEPEDSEADTSEDSSGGGNDSEDSGSDSDGGEADDSDGGDEDPSGTEESGTGGTESDDRSGDADKSDEGSDPHGGPSAGDGAESDSGRSDLGGDEEGGEVDADADSSSEGGEELGDSAGASEEGDPDGASSAGQSGDESASDADSEASEDAPEADEAGITGTGDVGEDQALGEGTGGEQDAESGGEDHSSGNAAPDGEPGGDLVAGGEPDESRSASEAGESDVDGDGSDADEPTDAGGSDPLSTEAEGDAEAAGEGHGDVAEAGDDDDLIDTGADAGHGGTELIEDPALEDKPIEMGTAEDAKVGLLKFGDHEDKPKTAQEKAEEKAVDVAIIQGLYFETPSRNITGVREHRWGAPQIIEGFNFSQAWDDEGFYSIMSRRSGRESDTEIAESILGPALMRMRVAFADNQRGHNKQHLKSGKVNGRVLGKRAHLGDPRLFRKKLQPGKKSYLVVIGMDVSGSTAGVNIALEKQAVMAQAELCRRMGIPFAIYAHSGNYWSPIQGRSSGFALDIYIIKEEHEPWDKSTQERLTKLGPDSANLDGHFLEYLRKRADESQATDVVILYYSDGKMPAENFNEELEILQREIKTCERKNYTLLGVGIRTDSPARHGLDTVQVNAAEDVGKVVKHLEKRLLAASSR